MNNQKQSMESILNKLTTEEKEYIYNAVRKKHIAEDVITHATEEMGITIDETTAQLIAKQWVEDNRYDCNYSYWANIESLINETANENQEVSSHEEKHG